MYAEDDAVAKLDGYVIAVAGAGRFIGEKRLVRIDSVGRTAASGALADLTEAEQKAAEERSTAAAAAGDGAGDKPKTRRRGRRGGRGRGGGSREKAEASSSDG
jgi:ribonuclease G